MKNQSLKLGKIKEEILSAFNLSLTMDKSLYIDTRMLDSLASRYPTSYLKIIERLSYIVKSPTYVGFDDEVGVLAYYEPYCHQGLGFLCYRFRLLGRPRKWSLVSLLKENHPSGAIIELEKRKKPRKG